MTARLNLGVLLCAALLAVAAPSSADDLTAPAVSECTDGVDNDGDASVDGYIDYAQGYAIPLGDDDGCFDDTPETEALSQAKRLTNRGARAIARDAADDVFRRSYRNAYYEKLTCKKRTRTRRSCEMFFAAGDHYYAARIIVFNYVDRSSDESESSYHLRGWKFTEECAQRDNPFSCASKRYRA